MQKNIKQKQEGGKNFVTPLYMHTGIEMHTYFPLMSQAFWAYIIYNKDYIKVYINKEYIIHVTGIVLN